MEDYLQVARELMPDKTEAEIELKMSASSALREFSGLTAHEHRKRGLAKLFPNRVDNEWRELRLLSVQECLEKGIQELGWMGSMSSGKSSDAADIILSLWWTRPEFTSVYITSPFKDATSTGIWSEIQDQYNTAKEFHPGLPGTLRHSDDSIVLYDKNPRSFIRVTTVDQIGKLVGKKSRSVSEGLIIFVLDELPAFLGNAARALISTLVNLKSNPNLLVIYTGNFASTTDAMGQIADPHEKDIPHGYEGFDPDIHFRWRTKRGGLCLRFDGLQSPNVKAGADIFPFLTRIKSIDEAAAAPGGLKSADSMRYIRSAPITNLDHFTMTTLERIRAGGCYDPVEWTGDQIKVGAFIDPGFGGDDCVLQKFKLGTAKMNGVPRQVFALFHAPYIIPVQMRLKREDGTEYTAEDQIVDQARDHCKSYGIPDDHIGFDGSLRSGIVQKFGLLWSPRIKAYDTNGPATDRVIAMNTKKTWKETVDRLLSEEWFVLQSLIDSGQIRELGLSPEAIEQFTARRWSWSAKGRGRKRVQTKPEYKDMLVEQGKSRKSPGEADALVGCIEVARGMGLVLNGVVINGGAMSLLLEIRNYHSMKEAVGYAKWMGRNEKLPSGHLHGMKSRTLSLNNGRLHRKIS